MHFGNEEQLSNYLKKSNLVPEGENIDIFIGYRYRYKNGEKLKMHEVIYGVKKGRCDDLTHIAEGKIKGRDVVEEKNHILDKFVGVLLVGFYIVRPLLKLKKQQLIDYCTKNHLEYHEDYTNYDTRYTRNHVRHIDLKKYNEQELIEKFKSLGYEVNSLTDIVNNGELSYKIKMYVRNKKEASK